MGREVGGGFRMGNTCTPVADACWCMAKPIQYCKVKKILKKKLRLKKKILIDKLKGKNVLSHFSPVWLSATPWTMALQAALSMGFSRQEYWSGLPFPFLVIKGKIGLCCCCCCIASVMSDSVRPHRRQPTRLPHPWDSPGKNTGVGCHFLLQCMKVKK